MTSLYRESRSKALGSICSIIALCSDWLVNNCSHWLVASSHYVDSSGFSFTLLFAAWRVQASYVSCLICLITIFISKVPFSVLLKGDVK